MTNEKLLEIDLCSRLPYRVKCQTPLGVMELTIIETESKFKYWFGYDKKVPSKHFNAEICNKNGFNSHGFTKSEIKPLYFPISCLTKPITVPNYNDGKEFVPLVMLPEHIGIDWCDAFDLAMDELSQKDCRFEALPHCFIEFFNMCLIDWRDLIGKGLAVEITEL